MATIVNQRDLQLQATVPRILLVASNYIVVTANTNTFNTSATEVTPSSIIVTANLSGQLSGTVTWTTSPVVVFSSTGNTLTIPASSVPLGTNVTVTASLTLLGQTYTSSTVISNQAASVSSSLSSSAALISTAADGTGGSYSSATSTMSVSIGIVDNSTAWTYSWTVPSGVTATGASTRTISVTDMTVDNASLMCTATRTGWPTQTKVFVVSKSKNGAAGTAVSIVFRRSAFQPATPSPSTGTPSDWYASVNTVPAGSDPVWSSIGTSSSSSNLTTWQTPVRVEGAAGTPGDSTRIAYKVQAQNLGVPAISATTSGNTSFPSGWTGTFIAPAAGQSLWAVDGIYNTPANTTTWGTPYLTQGFPTTIQSDNYTATTGWQIQRDTGDAFFNNITARGSIVTGTVGAQRLELNKANSNRINGFSSSNLRFLSIGGSGGTTADSAVVGISANANITNPVWIESTATTGSGILSNTLSTANAISSISTGNGRLFYGSITNGSNPDSAIRIDIDSVGHSNAGIRVNMGSSTGSAFTVGGTGNGYAFDAVSGTNGAAGSKSGIGFFRGIDFPTVDSNIVTSGTSAKIVVSFTGLTTAGALLYSVTLEGSSYSFILEYNSETFNNIDLFVIAISAAINNKWQVSSTGTLSSGSFIFTRPAVGSISGGSSVTVGSFTGTFINGTDTTYSETPVVVRLNPFPNDSNKVLRGDGTWDTVGASGGVSGYANKPYNVLDYGAVGDNLTDNTTAIQNAINDAKLTGGVVYFPRGVYKISSTLTYSAPAGGDPAARVHFTGDGIGASVLYQTGTGNGITLSGYTTEPANPNLYTYIYGLTFLGSNSGQGLSINAGAYVHVTSCHFTNWAYGFYGSNFLSSTFTACVFRFNQRGFLAERITASYSSSPNAINLVGCVFGANSVYGLFVLGPGVFNMQGGTVEVNGTGGSTGSASHWGMRISEPSGAVAIESAVGINISGVYFEGNIGKADIWLTSTSAKPGVSNNISGCSFVRIASNVVTNNIMLDASSEANGFNVFISGSGFKGLGGYSPTVSRMTIGNTSNYCKVDLLGCKFDSSVDGYVPGSKNLLDSGISTTSISATGTVEVGGVGPTILSGSLPSGLGLGNGVVTANSTIGLGSGFSAAGSGSVSAAIVVDGSTGSLWGIAGTSKLKLGTSARRWGTFSWGNYDIAEPPGTNTFLKADGTWASTLNTDGSGNLTIGGSLYTQGISLLNSAGTTFAGAKGVTTASATIGLIAGYSSAGNGSGSGGVFVDGSSSKFFGLAASGRLGLGSSTARWGTFSWGTYDIAEPPGGNAMLRGNGTWTTDASFSTTATNGRAVEATNAGTGYAIYSQGAIYSTGAITSENNITAYASSDISLKTNVTKISNALSKLRTLGGYEYDWLDSYITSLGGEDGYFVRKKDVGVIAQEVIKVLPEAVATKKDGTLGVQYDKLIPLLIEAILELDRRIK